MVGSNGLENAKTGTTYVKGNSPTWHPFHVDTANSSFELKKADNNSNFINLCHFLIWESSFPASIWNWPPSMFPLTCSNRITFPKSQKAIVRVPSNCQKQRTLFFSNIADSMHLGKDSWLFIKGVFFSQSCQPYVSKQLALKHENLKKVITYAGRPNAVKG